MFTLTDPKIKRKKLPNLTVFLVLLGSTCVKAASKMLVKLTPAPAAYMLLCSCLCNLEMLHYIFENTLSSASSVEVLYICTHV